MKMNEYEPTDEKQFNCGCCYSKGNWKQMLWMDETEVYGEILSQTFNIILTQDNLSGTICEQCIARLHEAVTFKQLVLDTQQQFQCKLESEMPVEYLEGYEDVALVKQESHGDSDYNLDNDFDDDSSDSEYEETLKEILIKRKNVKTTTVGGKLKSVGSSRKRKSKIDECVDSDAPSSSKKKIKGVLRSRDKLKERQNAAVIIENSNCCPFYCNRGTFMCVYCLKNFTDFDTLKQHTMSSHKLTTVIKTLPRKPVKLDTSNLKCNICLESFIDVDTFVIHLIEIHKKPYNKKFFNGVIAFKMEKVGDHFICHICNESLPSFCTLNRHINKHYSNYFCEYCAESFVTEERLKCHLATHEKGEFPCDRCGKNYASSGKLRSHINSVHLKKRRFKCPLCLEKFAEHNVKLRHMRQYHDYNLQFKCVECNVSFTTRRALTRHRQKEHLPQFICQICGRSYIQKGLLKVHELAVHGNANFSCTICSKSYRRKYTLNKHLKTHGKILKEYKIDKDLEFD